MSRMKGAIAIPAAVLPVTPSLPAITQRFRRRLLALSRPALLLAGATAGIVVTGVAGIVGELSSRTARAVRTSPGTLDLTVEGVGTALQVRWDKNSSAIGAASHAVLTVIDGARETKIGLTREQLRSGTTTYWPVTSDVS